MAGVFSLWGVEVHSDKFVIVFFLLFAVVRNEIVNMVCM